LNVLIPAALLTAGVALVWHEMTSAWEAGTRPGKRELARVAAGLALLVGGAISFLTDSNKLAGLSSALIAAAVVAAGLGLLVGPRLAQARAEADEERRRRILADERADTAARLHDSVLQTLALIQREDDPRRAQSLARRQERELRGWLFRGEAPGDAATLASALRTATAEVEEHYGIEVDLVQASDGPLDEGLAALAAAAREAMTNAGRHAGVEKVSVFARVADDEASVFVRDSGRGFDPAAVAEDRQGLRESIIGRMERCGGRAAVLSTPGEGTEVELVLPRTGR
jgi:signal transduction histidine kinase